MGRLYLFVKDFFNFRTRGRFVILPVWIVEVTFVTPNTSSSILFAVDMLTPEFGLEKELLQMLLVIEQCS